MNTMMKNALTTTRVATRQRKTNMAKHTNQTRTACCLTLATLALIALTTVSVHTMNYVTSYYGARSSSITNYHHRNHNYIGSTYPHRFVEENQNDNHNNNNDNGDYSSQTCDDIFTLTEPASADRCLFSQQCNSNQGLQFNFIFCSTFNLSTTTWVLILSPFLLIWLIVLFRMLGSTAEDFFSPSLEMFSIKMGLPPRFAGVTLLALGNGAADVSATINAISQNPSEGYLMSLGALTGAGMFVGTVVAGIVIVLADGVKCRGALVRDVLMYILTIVVVYRFFESGQIGNSAIQTFLWMYVAFVVVVLIADVYHRAVVLPRLRKLEVEQSMISMCNNGGDDDVDDDGRGQHDNDNDDQSADEYTDALEQVTGTNTFSSIDNSPNNRKKVSFAPPGEGAGDVELATTTAQSASLIATDSTYDTASDGGETYASSLKHGETETFSDNAGVSSDDDDNNDSSGRKKSNKFKLKRPKFGKKKNGKVSKVQQGVDRIMMALSNYGPNEGNPNNNTDSYKGWSGGLEVTSESFDRPIRLHGQHGILNRRSSDEVNEDEVSEANNGHSNLQGSYRILLENVDNLCTVDGSTSSGMNISWGNSLSTGWDEFVNHFVEYYNDIFENPENNGLDKFLLVCELPFSVMRKLTVSIPCDDYYCRGLVAISFALAPLWFGIYFLIEKDTNIFFTGGTPIVEVASMFTVLISLFIMKFAPAEEQDMSLAVSVPIAFVGFVVAATWIDTIADQLVSLLTLLGVICRIPGSIMGITILAWGNSMGDLSANMTMAKKGLANMAITACFAGPVFNILIGLGGGFTKLHTSTGAQYTEVNMSWSIKVGFIFLAINCALVLVGGLVWNRGHIPKGYGYVALTLYIIYVFLSIWLQFKDGNNNEM